ncbi:MAG: hypothetical protein H6618_03040 [Deltaproteobacteria bacterium]|nr:hypothetical protein [Deltaproteobacteria bacterium]
MLKINKFPVVAMTLLLISIVPVLQHCGFFKKTKATGDEPSSSMVEIPVQFVNKNIELNLSSLSLDYRMRLVGCKSGYTADPIALNTSSVSVYHGDEGCVLELLDVEIGGARCREVSGFTDFQVGDLRTCVYGDDDEVEMRTEVSSQLSNPIVADDVVRYTFWEVRSDGSTEISTEDLKNRNAVTLEGDFAPPYKLSAVQMVKATRSIVPATFYMECLDQGYTEGSDFFCYDQAYSELTYVVSEWDESVDITLEFLNTLFASAQKSVKDYSVLSGNGFSLRHEFQLQELNKHMNYLLAFKNTGGSYTYYILKVRK